MYGKSILKKSTLRRVLFESVPYEAEGGLTDGGADGGGPGGGPLGGGGGGVIFLGSPGGGEVGGAGIAITSSSSTSKIRVLPGSIMLPGRAGLFP